MKTFSIVTLLLILAIISSCKSKTSSTQPESELKYRKAGSIEQLSAELNRILDTSSRAEILASGFEWAEGPLWLPGQEMLIFSDVPNNTVYQWTESDSIKIYLKPAGFTDTTVGIEGRQGSNGLMLDAAGRLILCQHGDRRIARMEAPLGHPTPKFTTLVDKYNGKRLNSPNDAVSNSQGDIYFTDPPYGLEKGYDDPARELDYTGVFKISSDGNTTLVTDKMSAPNGIAFSPDEKKLFVANSGEKNEGFIMVYDIKDDGSAGEGTIFFKSKSEGGFDGLKMRKDGILFAAGADGIYIINPKGEHLGTILTGEYTSNCAFDKSGNTLYITAHNHLMRFRLK